MPAADTMRCPWNTATAVDHLREIHHVDGRRTQSPPPAGRVRIDEFLMLRALHVRQRERSIGRHTRQIAGVRHLQRRENLRLHEVRETPARRGEHDLLDHREAVVAIDGQLAGQMLQMRVGEFGLRVGGVTRRPAQT